MGCIDENGKKIFDVPLSVFRSPQKVVREFLRGLFESDGNASAYTIRLHSKERRLISSVQLLLLGFGINSLIRLCHGVKFGKQCMWWELSIRSGACLLFADRIGFIGARKNLLARRYNNKRRIPEGLYDVVKTVEPYGLDITYDLTVEGSHVFSANGILTHNTPAEAFVASGRCAFSKKRLNDMITHFCRPAKWTGEIRLDEKDNTTPRLSRQYEGRFQIWEFPKGNMKYYVAGDPSMGIDGGDPACAQVLAVPDDINQPLRQVARWHGYAPPTQFARILAAIGYVYNTAEIAPECNTITTVASDLVKVLLYPKWYRWMREDKAKNAYSNWIGWQTTFRNKNELIGRYREALDQWTVIIRCEADIDEMFDFVEEEEGTERYSARSGGTDDCVMTHMIAYYCATQLRPRSAADIEEKPAPGIETQQNTDYSPIYDQEQAKEGADPDFYML
jgi:hypothetical protein